METPLAGRLVISSYWLPSLLVVAAQAGGLQLGEQIFNCSGRLPDIPAPKEMPQPLEWWRTHCAREEQPSLCRSVMIPIVGSTIRPKRPTSSTRSACSRSVGGDRSADAGVACRTATGWSRGKSWTESSTARTGGASRLLKRSSLSEAARNTQAEVA
jgi:hypothetical protein